jgi:hypothetical protein
MSEHVTLERLSALLDEPGGDEAAVTHLEGCGDCQREYQALGRMRMALSGLPDLRPPADSWGLIESALPVIETSRRGVTLRPRRRSFGLLSSWPLQAAAALILFAGGLAIGTRLREAGTRDTIPSVVTAPPSGAQPATDIEPGRLAYEDALRKLRELRAASAEVDAGTDPAAAAERLIRLDALVAASREALRKAPEDPAVNDFLFEVVDERDALSAELDDVLHAATVEYR